MAFVLETRPASAWLRRALTVLITLGLLFAVAYWGGAAKVDALFFLGVAVLSGILVAFGALTWWLYLSPLPEGNRGRTRAGANASASAGLVLKPVVRQVVGLLAVVSGLLFVTGAVWDETWHKLYGIGGPINDFYWPPHKLLYGSMALSAFFAGGGMLLLLRGRGDLRARFRSEPLIGLLGLASGYLAISAPSDQLWHIIYGLDITGWSLPHISITVGAALVMLSTAGLLLSQVPAAGWRGLGGQRFFEALAFLMMGAALLPVSQAALVEWDALTRIGDPRINPAFWARPEWIYPVVVASVAVFFSLFALHATRRIGAATVTLLLALALRGLLLTLSHLWDPRAGVNVNVFLLMLLPAAALDLWYWLRRGEVESGLTRWGGPVVAAGVFLLVGLPRIAATMVYPRVNGGTVPGMVVFTLLLALWFGWAGAQFGQWMGGVAQRGERAPALSPRVVWLGAATLLMLAVASAVLMLTAQPPSL